MAGGAKNKAKDRQSRKRAGYYERQRDKTVVNKLITWARHIVRFNDRPSLDRLRQQTKVNLSRAARIAESPRVKALLVSAGPVPNAAMRLKVEVDAAIARATKGSGE